ncbi:hypothetical protein D3C77_666900 [compost metagenome]
MIVIVVTVERDPGVQLQPGRSDGVTEGNLRLDHPPVGADVDHPVLVIVAVGNGEPDRTGKEGFRCPLREFLLA